MGKNVNTQKPDTQSVLSAIEVLAQRERKRLNDDRLFLRDDQTACKYLGPQIRAIAHEVTGEWLSPKTSPYRQVRLLAEKMVRDGLLIRSPLENGSGAIISYWPAGLAETMRTEGAGNGCD